MDFNTNHDHVMFKADSHYEYTLEKGRTDPVKRLKQQVFSSMDTLEGWCSKEKASELIDLIIRTKPETIVEIGVWGGKSLIPMAYALKYNQKGKVYGIDPWEANESAVGMDGVNKTWWSSAPHEAVFKGLQKKIAEFGLQSFTELVRATSANATPIADIDILHIDGNHSEEMSYLDVDKWVPFVRNGGYIVFDDINWSTTGRAVQWLDENCVKVAEFRGDNIWGIWQKP